VLLLAIQRERHALLQPDGPGLVKRLMAPVIITQALFADRAIGGGSQPFLLNHNVLGPVRLPAVAEERHDFLDARQPVTLH
jgi:hypothetical protein